MRVPAGAVVPTEFIDGSTSQNMADVVFKLSGMVMVASS